MFSVFKFADLKLPDQLNPLYSFLTIGILIIYEYHKAQIKMADHLVVSHAASHVFHLESR